VKERIEDGLFNLKIGLTTGFISYIISKNFTGRFNETSIGMWLLGGFSLLFFIFYPY